MKLFNRSIATISAVCLGVFTVCSLTSCNSQDDGAEAIERLSLLLDEKVEATKKDGLSGDLEVPYSIVVNDNEYVVDYSTNNTNATYKVEENGETKKGIVAIVQTGEDQTFTLKAKVAEKEKSWDFKIAKKDLSMVKTQAEIDAMENKMTYAQWAAAKPGTPALIQGYVTHAHDFSASYGNASVWLQDDEGGYYGYRVLVASQSDFDEYFKVGNKIAIEGSVSPYNDWQEMAQKCKYYYIKDAEPKTYEFKDVTATWSGTAADTDAAKAVQNQKIKVTGKVTSIPEASTSSMTLGLSVGGQDYNVYFKSAYTKLPTNLASTLKIGYTVTVEGIGAVAKVDGKNCAQICPIKTDAVTVVSTTITAQDKVNGAKAEVAKQDIQKAYYDSLKTPLDLLTTTKDGCTVTYSVTDPSGETKYTTNTTAKGANMVEGNNAEAMGLPATIFTVTGDKGAQNYLPWIAPNSYRLYSSADGNGASMNFSVATGCTIKSVKFTLAADSKPDAVAKVTTGTTEVTGTDGVYEINASSFKVQNVVEKVSTQLKFSAIEIVVDVKVEQDIKLVDGNKLSVTVNPDKAYATKLTATISLEDAKDVLYSWDIVTKSTSDVEKEIKEAIEKQDLTLTYDATKVGSRQRLLEVESPSSKEVTATYSISENDGYVIVDTLKNSTQQYFEIKKTPETGAVTVDLICKFKYNNGAEITVQVGKIVLKKEFTPYFNYTLAAEDEVISEAIKGVVSATGYGTRNKNCFAMVQTSEGAVYVFQSTGDKEKWAATFVVGKTVTLKGGKKDIHDGLHEYVISDLAKQVTLEADEAKTLTPEDVTALVAKDLTSAAWVAKQGAYASITGTYVKDGNNYYLEVGGKKIQVYFDAKFSEAKGDSLEVGKTYTITGIIGWFSKAQLIPVSTTFAVEAK